VTLPDGSVIKSTHTTSLNIPNLPPQARRCHVFPALAATGSLLSVGKFCDHGCVAIYDKETVKIFHEDKLILTGHRSPVTRLWMIDIDQQAARVDEKVATPPQQQTAAASICNEAEARTVEFLHAAAGSPALSTFITAIEKGFLH